MHEEVEPIRLPCFTFEVERFDDDEDIDCNTTAEPAAVDDDGNGIDDEEVFTGTKFPKQCGHCSGWVLHDIVGL